MYLTLDTQRKVGTQMIIDKSLEHLKDNNMGYWKHFKFASGHGLRCIKAGVLLMLHAIVPAFFPKTGSVLVNELNKSFTEHNDYLHLKNRVEAFSKMIYTSDDGINFKRSCK